MTTTTLNRTQPDTRQATRRRTRGFDVSRAITYLVLVVALVVTLLPLVWMFLSSFKTQGDILGDPTSWFPKHFTFDNYAQWFGPLNIGQYFTNTLVVAVVTVLGNLVFCSMAGYALAKMRFRGKNVVFTLVLITLMVPAVVTFIPMFVTVSKLGLLNTYASLFLPFLASPIGVFLMRQFIAGIPDSLIEAARLDGAGEARIFLRIVMPLCGAPLATLAILTFLTSWNNFLWPLVAAQGQSTYTLPIALSLFSVGQNATQYGLLLAGSTLVIAPVVVLFLALQRYFTQSVVGTGIK
ncbi:carbohydrate ABC transporter permease [Leifsonia sp. NPDC080035]|uniref:Carbohydrate ABC transporter permease n=1 Tax=Leifsonia sp. NPDC080035 TaxID=3143936 RepID=A0AAU7G8J4_9MICO